MEDVSLLDRLAMSKDDTQTVDVKGMLGFVSTMAYASLLASGLNHAIVWRCEVALWPGDAAFWCIPGLFSSFTKMP